MLQKIKYEALDFGAYDKLRKIFFNDEHDPSEIDKLDLCK